MVACVTYCSSFFRTPGVTTVDEREHLAPLVAVVSVRPVLRTCLMMTHDTVQTSLISLF